METNEVEQFDQRYPNVALATILIASSFNRDIPKEHRIAAAVAAKRLTFAPEVPQGAEIININEQGINTIAHCLGLYNETEANCEHFGDTPPTELDVERLQRLIGASNLYVVIKDVKEFADNEEKIELAESTPVLSDILEDEAEEYNPVPAPSDISQERFNQLFPHFATGAAHSDSDQVANILNRIDEVVNVTGVDRSTLLKGLSDTHTLMGKALYAARLN